MESPLDLGDAIALLALLLSAYATATTRIFNERQKSLIESQKRLNELLVQKESAESESSKQAQLGACFVPVGSGKYKFRVFNKGKAIAKNVMIDILEDSQVISDDEIKERFPLESLDVHQAVEMPAFVHMRSKRKLAVRLIWSDEFGERNEKLVHATI